MPTYTTISEEAQLVIKTKDLSQTFHMGSIQHGDVNESPSIGNIKLTESHELHGENDFLSFKKCDCITQTQANANCVLVHKNNGETKREYLQWRCCLVTSSFDLDEKAHVQRACQRVVHDCNKRKGARKAR